MNSRCLLPCLLLSLAPLASARAGGTAALPEAQKIDEILARHWVKQGVTPNAPAPDEVFLRRVYLDIVGRIPTLEEARTFLQSQAADKRAKLIDQLLASPGYASHYFNYFADLLRVLTEGRDGVTGKAYAEWLKQALLANKPYDQLVSELITAEGGAWDSGAIGFYMRDRGMPLDHLAATVQVFLGTRIECAQCHNHPFDKWTQRDYYQLAAFTYGMDTRGNYGLGRGDMQKNQLRKMRVDDGFRESFQMVKQNLNEVMKPLRYTSVHEEEKPLKLPHDYQYDDGKPGDVVVPVALFGHAAEAPPGASRAEVFADWMTNPANPRFTTVIANRLWKKVMGAGLIEPVDEMMDSTVPVNGELMSYLERLMAAKDYNLKSFLRVLFNSELYQRMPAAQGLALGEIYHFPGPLVRRLSAEQVWDSIVTLTHGDVDAQTAEPDTAVAAHLASLEKLHAAVTSKDPLELVRSAQEMRSGAARAELDQEIRELTAAIAVARKAGDTAKARELNAEVNRLRQSTRESAFASVLGAEQAALLKEERKTATKKAQVNKRPGPVSPGGKTAMRAEFSRLMSQGLSPREARQKLAKQSKQLRRDSQMVNRPERASELPSPAPRGHFLRTFGQSDRDTIENANLEASVPQALNLMNGPVPAALLQSGTAFSRYLEAATSAGDKLDTVYLSLLSRRPSHNERQMLAGVLAERDEKAIPDIVHALLNTGEFLFVR